MQTDPLTPTGRLGPPSAVSGIPAAGEPVVIDSDRLLGKSRELLILHNNRLYRLRETSNGKLILTA